MESGVPESLQTEDAFTKLASMGWSADTIALAFEVPRGEVRAILTKRRPPAPEEDQLQEEARRLVQHAIRKAAVLMDYGTTDTKTRIILSLLGSTKGLITHEDSGSTEEHRIALDQLLNEMKAVPTTVTEVVTDTDIIEVPDVEARTITQATHDQDKG